MRKMIFTAAAAAIAGGAFMASPTPATADVSVRLGVPGVHIGVGGYHGYNNRAYRHNYGYYGRSNCWTEHKRVRVRYYDNRRDRWRVKWDTRRVRVCR